MNKIICGDSLEVLKEMKECSVNCCVTSPPYWGLRDYGTAKWEGGDPNCNHEYQKECKKCGAIRIDNQLGLEKTPEEYIVNMVKVFKEVKRVLREDGTLWLNIGDTYWGGGWRNSKLSEKSGIIQKNNKGSHCGETVSIGTGKHSLYKTKDLVGIPWMLAFALRQDGWWLRQDIIWSKKNCMPESTRDRCTKSHEYIFLLSKSKKYYYDYELIKEDSANIEKLKNSDKKKYLKRNKRSVWNIGTRSFPEAHFAVFPPKLIEPCILAGCPENGIVLDPFMGSGTTAMVAKENNRNYLGIELNPEYIEIAKKQINKVKPKVNKNIKGLFK